jgi:hypothetical protein
LVTAFEIKLVGSNVSSLVAVVETILVDSHGT